MSEPRRADATGVLGGTFDPVHLGHLRIADAVRRGLRLPRMLLLPAAAPPHKHRRALSPAAQREAMVRLALREWNALELSTFELRRNRTCYTIDTLRALRDGPPACRPVFVLGLDSLQQITTWRNYRQLLAEFDLAVLDRPGRGGLALVPDEIRRRIVEVGDDPPGADVDPGRGGRVFRLRIAPIPISSSRIRRRAARGLSLLGLVPAAVAGYIERTGLYREEKRP